MRIQVAGQGGVLDCSISFATLVLDSVVVFTAHGDDVVTVTDGARTADRDTETGEGMNGMVKALRTAAGSYVRDPGSPEWVNRDGDDDSSKYDPWAEWRDEEWLS